MSTYFCNTHFLQQFPGWTLPLNTDLTGSTNQLTKFLKHTSDPYLGKGVVSKYNFTDYPTYANFLHRTFQSGSLEIDQFSRYNLLLPLSGSVGLVYEPAGTILPVDVVKVVKPHQLTDIHHFATGSWSFAGAVCSICGCPIV